MTPINLTAQLVVTGFTGSGLPIYGITILIADPAINQFVMQVYGGDFSIVASSPSPALSGGSFLTKEDAIAFFLNSTNKAAVIDPIIAAVNSAAGGSYYTYGGYVNTQLGAGGIPAISSLTLAPVAAGTGSTGGNTGTQISALKTSLVVASYSTQFTYALSGNPQSGVVLKICATNDANEANWMTTAGRTEAKLGSGLAITVGQQVVSTGMVSTVVPSGWYVKAVQYGAGTHSEAQVDGQEVIYG